MSYYDKYLKYKAKYAKLKHLENLYKNKDWPGIVKANETKYRETINLLRETEPRLQELIDAQTEANNNYYKDISNRDNEKTLKIATKKMNDLKNKINKLQKLVGKTNKAWKNSIIQESEARVKAAQKDVDAARAYLMKDKKNIIIAKKLLDKAIEAQRKAENKLQRDIASEQESEVELSKTVEIVNRVRQEQSDTLAGLEARTAPPPVNRPNMNNNNDQGDQGDQAGNYQ